MVYTCGVCKKKSNDMPEKTKDEIKEILGKQG